MATVKKKRGRQKTERTLERERTEEMFRNIPAHCRMTPSEGKEARDQIAASRLIEKQLLKEHKSPPMPAKLVFQIESAGPELMTDAQIQETISEYARVAKNIQEGQEAGGQKLADKADERRNKVLQKNHDIAVKVTTQKWSVNRGATKLYDEWDKLGDGLPRPAIRTLRRWLNIFLAENINSLDKAIPPNK
jgi:hypothetical protein